MDGLVGRTRATLVNDTGAVGPTASKAVMDTICSVINQPNGALDLSCTKPRLQNKESGGSSNLLIMFFNTSTGAESFKAPSNFSSLTPMSVSYFNPVFVGQEASEGDGSYMHTKADSSVSGLFEVHVADSPGGLNLNRHTTISFNEKGPAEGDQLRKINVPTSVVNKIQSMGKLMGTVFTLRSADSGAIGQGSGGIWVEWKDNICFNIIHNHPQFIPNKAKRKSLWTDLLEVIPSDPILWLILRDFDAILSPKDKKSDRSTGKRCKLFGNFVDSCNLQDLGSIGPAFTWQRGNTQERIDRSLANDSWISTFRHTLVYHLPLIKSDHRPILININLDLSLPKGRPFCFLTGGTKHVIWLILYLILPYMSKIGTGPYKAL
ncbi:reverse transcriptase [Gossypium australe]|uniref:Reverse transcriptase n=1 Tax=Gossypium australe TaxID=47621 RepID=A0A5B6WKB1_9ROSI|nr:reverse transcriptase [Gossypium australe]